MQRAVILLVVMTILGAGLGIWVETGLSAVCQRYLAQAEVVRQLVETYATEEALQEERFLYASWQGESRKLNALVSHHHTRAVDEALLHLDTALHNGWREEAILALDVLLFSLMDLETDMTLRWENIL